MSSQVIESVSVAGSPTDEAGVEWTSGVWASRACDNVGVSIGMGERLVLGIFRRGDGVFRGVWEGVFTTGGGDSCFRFATASE